MYICIYVYVYNKKENVNLNIKKNHKNYFLYILFLVQGDGRLIIIRDNLDIYK